MISSLYSSILRRQPRTAHCSWLARVRRIAQVRRFRMFFRPEPLKGPTMKADFMFGFHYLVGGSTPLKNMSSSVGMMTFPIYIYMDGKIQFMFQTTNQSMFSSFKKTVLSVFSYYESVIGVPEAVGCDPNFRVCGPGKGPGPRRERIQVHNGSSRNSMVPLYRWMIWMVYEQKTLTYLEMDELGVPP